MAAIVIIGAGLAGSLLAARLSARHQVTIIERGRRNQPLAIRDRGRSAALAAHAGCGPGGTTALWHNGLIALEDDDYGAWPPAATAVKAHLPAAHVALSGTQLDRVGEAAAVMRSDFVDAGVPTALLGRPLFYPARRRNLWKSERLATRDVALVHGRVERLCLDDAGRVREVMLQEGRQRIRGDVFILCAGGLGSPLVLQASSLQPAVIGNAGRHYFDHPVGFVAAITVRANFNRLWNRHERGLGGSVRLPLVVRIGARKFAFYLRPAGATGLRVKSVLSDLRNAPLDPRLHVKLLLHTNDIVEALSLRVGINIPTRRFVLYMSAQQLPQDNLGVSHAADGDHIVRDWVLDGDFLAAANAAVAGVLDALAPSLESRAVIETWPADLSSAAHHCGTCRMAASAEHGVCDGEGRVYGTANLFVCDGSSLPGAGYANTGLTIGALALRLAEIIDG
ncbi:MAG: GMC family oxidoreductase [Proteobacteria bacterium]|nr:GMC family oxidoreductase [Pseudomonadota bacterium]